MKEKTLAIIAKVENKKLVIAGVGGATFFFGFFAGAMLNLYLVSIHSPLVTQLRASLSFKSAIYGDGIILPVVNMICASFLLNQRKYITNKIINWSLVLGGLITAYFHVSQAMRGLVNWTMPTPWHWNFLGVWHAVYMFSVCTLLSLFLIVTIKTIRREKSVPWEFWMVLFGVVIFLVLLRLDYSAVSLSDFVPY